MQSHAASAQPAPAKVMQVGETVIRIHAPAPMTEAEREYRHQQIVKAVAACLKDASSH